MKKVRKLLALVLTTAMVSTFVIPASALPGGTLGVIDTYQNFTSTLWSTAAPWSGSTYLDGNGYTTPVAYTGIQHIQFDVTPGLDNCDEVIAYADKDVLVQNFNQLAMLVRMNDAGSFDVRNGAAMSYGTNQQHADTVVPYTAGTQYRVEIVADMTAKTYSVYVTTPDGTKTKIAADYGFRAQAAPSTDDIGQVFFTQGVAGHEYTVKNHMIRPQIDSAATYLSTTYATIPTFDNPYNFLQNIGAVTDTPKAGTSVVAFDITPNAAALDQSVGYADSSTLVDVNNDFSMQIRFNASNEIDCRNGGGFAKLTPVAYVPGTVYHVEILADMTSKKYSVWVTPNAGVKTKIASNYAFRSGGAGALADDIGQVIFNTSSGAKTYTVNNHTITAGVNPVYASVVLGSAPVTPTGFTAPAAGQTITWVSSDPTKATINSAAGTLTAVGIGNTVASYTVTDDVTGLIVVAGSVNVPVTEVMMGTLDTKLQYNALMDRSQLPGYNSFADPNYLSRTAWSLGTTNTGIQEVQFDVTPTANNVDGVIAYTDSSIEVKDFLSFAMLVSLDTNGFFRVRNGANHLISTYSYTAGTTYRVRLRANLSTKVYDVWVKDLTNSGEETLIGPACAFNTRFGSTAGANTDDIGKVCFIQDTYPGAPIFTIKNHMVRPQVSPSATYLSTTYVAAATVDNPYNFLQNIGVVTDTPKTGTQMVAFDITPNAAELDQSVGFSDSSTLVNVNNDLAIQVRLNSASMFDIRNGGSFKKVNDVTYVAGTKYHVQIVADMNAKKYSVWVTPNLGTMTLIAANCSFRSGGAGALADDIGQVIYNTSSSAKTYTVQNQTFTSITPVNPTVGTVKLASADVVTPTGFTAPAADQTIVWTSSDATKATIDASTGVITPLAAGTTSISYIIVTTATNVVVAFGSVDVPVLPEDTLGVLAATSSYDSTLDRSVVPGWTLLADPYYLSGTAYTSATVNTGMQNIQFDVTPALNNQDGVIAYTDSSIPVKDFTSFAMLLSLRSDGFFGVRNGDNHLVSTLPYTAGTKYHVEIVANMTAKTYSVWVTPDEGVMTNIGTDCAFNSRGGSTAGANTDDIGKACFIQDNYQLTPTFTVTNHMIRPMLNSTTTYNSSLYSTEAPFTDATYLLGSGYDMGNSNTGMQYMKFDVTPSNASTGASILYADSAKSVGNYNDGAIQVRMGSGGTFDVRNGANFEALAAVPYTVGQASHVEIVANMTAKTYSVWVTPQGGERTQVALDYGFRAASAATTDDIGQVFFTQETAGTDYTVMNHEIYSLNAPPALQNPTIGTVKMLAGDVTPTGFTAPIAGETIIWESYNTSIATVNVSTGAITPVAVGSTTIAYTVINALNAVVAYGSAEITVLQSDTQNDKDALTADLIKGANPSLDEVTVSLAVLPIVGAVDASTISWTSDKPLVISDDGQTVVRPLFGSPDEVVTLTATITNGATVDTKVFTITVLALPQFSIDTTFTVGSTPNATTLVANNLLLANSTITSNMLSGSAQVLVIVALYDANGAMVNVSYISKDVAAGATETISAGFKLPADVTGYTAKTFVWDGSDIMTSTMTPLSNVIEIGNPA